MQLEYCDYPPRLAADLEITEQLDGNRQSWIIGTASVNRYIILRETEFKVFQLIEEGLNPPAICAEFKQRYGGTLTLTTLTKFLAKLEQVGILAGRRSLNFSADRQIMRQPYVRLRLFNPDRLFAQLVPGLQWIWTPGFLVASLFLMLTALFLSARNWAELSSYGNYIIQEHYLVMFIAAWIVVATHEFAHGLTCKMFGGRATEIGILGVYYFIPALYCNVSGIHQIKKRGHRLWVIAAGVYWQLLVGTTALLVWFIVEPYTLLSDLALAFCLGSLLNIVFNANPLIKLDGYYFLSQLLRLPNLMDRSRDFWRGLWKRIAYGERQESAARYSSREKGIYAIFGFLSISYTAVLTYIIISYVGNYLINEFQLLGLLLTLGVIFLFLRRPLRSLLSSATGWIGAFMINPSEIKSSESSTAIASTVTPLRPVARNTNSESSSVTTDEKAQLTTKQPVAKAPKTSWRRRLVPAVLLTIVAIVLSLPWEASVGSFGNLTPLKEKEAIITAPESGIVTIMVKPGDSIEVGKQIARLNNPDLNSDLIGLRADIVRAEADYERLLGDIKTRVQATEQADVKLSEAERVARELKAEQNQILGAKLGGRQEDTAYPAAIAVLQSDVDLKKSHLDEAEMQLNRTRQLFRDNLIPKSDLEMMESKVVALRLEVQAAREKVQNAIVEHRRAFEKSSSDVRLNQSELQSAKTIVTKTATDLDGTRRLLETLRQREQVLLAKQTSVVLTAPRAGTLLGENLLELNGKYLEKGAEIGRVADTKQLLVRIQVPEREIGDVQEGASVRLKARALPDRLFQGHVEKIGSEAELDQNKQMTYRVELIIDNADGSLKPGMTAFTRIGFGQKTVGWILWHKLKQALRPELWLF